MPFRLLIFIFAMGLLVGETWTQNSEQAPSAVVKCATLSMPAPPVSGVLASDGERIYAGTANGTLSSFDSSDLSVAWRVELGGEFISGIAFTESGAVVVTNSSGSANGSGGSTIRHFSKDSGVPTWSAKLPLAERYYLGRINGTVAAISSEGSVTLLDRLTGALQFQVGPLGKLSAKPSFSTTSVLLATLDKSLIVVSAKTGGIVVRHSTEFVTTSVALLKNERIAAGDERGNVKLFGVQDTKTVWRFKSGAGVTFIAEANEGILVTSLDNFVYFISDYNGDVIWKRRLTGRVAEGGITIENNFVVVINGENSAFVIDLFKGKVTDAIPSTDNDLINRVPVHVRDKIFVLSTLNSLDLYSLAACPAK